MPNSLIPFQEVITFQQKRISRYQRCLALGLCCLIFPLLFCWMPLIKDELKDTVHYCPSCKLGVGWYVYHEHNETCCGPAGSPASQFCFNWMTSSVLIENFNTSIRIQINAFNNYLINSEFRLIIFTFHHQYRKLNLLTWLIINFLVILFWKDDFKINYFLFIFPFNRYSM